MPDYIEITDAGGTKRKVSVDEIESQFVQRLKMQFGKDGTAADVSTENPLPVNDAGGTLSVDDGGGAISVDDNGSTLSVDDGGGSLTVDGTVAVSGTVPVSDGAGSLTVDSADLGTTADAESESGSGSVIALLKRLRKLLEGTGKIIVPKIEGELPEGTKALGKVKVSTIEGEPKVKVSALEGEPTVKVGGELPTGTKSIGKVKALEEALPAGSNNIGQVDPRGNVAHDGADSGNPIKVGARARTALPAAVSQDDRTDNISDKFGRQLATVAPLDERTSATLNRTNTESGQLLAALAEGAYVVTAITVTNAHATVGTKVEILDGETVKWKGYAVAAGGGFVIADPNGLFVGTKNTKLNGKCATTGADVDITVSAYKIPA
jgi:hypothetical protein